MAEEALFSVSPCFRQDVKDCISIVSEMQRGGADLFQLIFEAIEKGDISGLKSLVEPPMTVDTIVRYFF